MSLIIFSSLDRILVETERSKISAAKNILEQLQLRNIPLVFISDRTRAAVSAWQARLEINTPFIVEYGSGIFLPNDCNFDFVATIPQGNYHVKQLGCTYTEARAALKAIQEDISKILRGFGDMSDADIQKLVDISLDEAKQDKAREFSEVFINPTRIRLATLKKTALEYGFKVIAGKSLSSIVGGDASKKTAIEWLLQNYSSLQSEKKITSVGIGTSDRDVELLGAVDVPVVVPNNEEIEQNLAKSHYKIVSSSDFAGWLEALDFALNTVETS